MDGFIVDVVRPDELVEIQTASFSSAAHKLRRLVDRHRIRLVHPIAAERWLVRVDEDGAIMSRRRSPRRGLPVDVFDELVAMPELVAHANFTLEVLLTHEEEVRGPIPPGARYRYPREWWRLDRRLLGIVETIVVSSPADLTALLPPLPDPFTSADVREATGRSKRICMRAAYCLAKAGTAAPAGKRGRLQAYRLVDDSGRPAVTPTGALKRAAEGQ